MKDLELLEKYILKQLNVTEINEVNERIKNEPPFAKLYAELKTTIAALEHNWLKQNLTIAKRNLYVKKVFKIAMISILGIALIGYGIFKLKKENNITEQSKINAIITDSIIMNVNDTNLKLGENNSYFGTKVISDSFFKYSKKDNNCDTLANPKIVLPNADVYIAFNVKNLFQPEIQEFKIDPTKDNEITCKYGTTIRIQKLSIVNGGGALVMKPINLKIQEYVNYSQMWQQNIATTSDSNLLYSGGSCHIQATLGEKEVFISKSKTFEIDFKGTNDKDMKTFEGQRTANGNMNWQLTKISKPKSTNFTSLVRIPLKEMYGDFRLPDSNYYLQPVVTDEGYYRSKYEFNQLPKEKMTALFDTFSKLRSKTIRKLYESKKQIQLRFQLNNEGYLTKFDYNFKNNRKFDNQLKACAESVLNKTKVEFPAGTDMSYKIVNVNLLPKLSITKPENFDIENDKNNQLQTARKDINTIICRNFGYINCDIFAGVKNKTSIKINIPTNYTNVMVFFKNYRAVANCYNSNNMAIFNNAPKGENILIVATYVKNEVKYQEIKEAIVGDTITLENFVEYNYEVLEKRLNTYR